MIIFAEGRAAPESPVTLENGAILVVETRRERSAVTRIADGAITVCDVPVDGRPSHRDTVQSEAAA